MIPFKDITKLGHKNMLDKGVFNVSWILGRFCNYDCSYCWPYARSKILDHRPFEVYTRTVDEIKRQAKANGFNKFHFSFSGGEPTAYKKLIDLVDNNPEKFSPNLKYTHIFENFFNFNWWLHLINSFDK